MNGIRGNALPNNMKIGTKLYLGFGVLLMLILVLVATARWGTGTLNEQMANTLNGNVKLAEHAYRARANTLGLRRSEKDIFINIASADTVAKYYKDWNTQLEHLNARLADLEKTAIRPEDKSVVKSMKDNTEKYAAGFNRIYRMVLSGEIKSTQDGNRAMGEYKDETHKVVADAITLSQEMSKQIGIDRDNSAALADKALTVILSIALFSILLGVVTAILITRAITRPLVAMQAMITEVEQTSDFSKRVSAGSTDEIGQTAAAFDKLMDALQQGTTEVNRVVGAIAAGDFGKRVEADLKGDLKVMKEAVNASAQSVKVTMDGLGEVMKSLYNGDFSARMTAEVKGEFKLAVDQAMQAMQAMLGDVGGVMNAVSQGNLTQRVRAEGRGDLAKLKENINASLDALSGAMRAINANTRQVAAAASQSSTAVGQIADGAQNQMHAINQVAAAVRQTAASVTDVSSNTEAASHKSQESVAIVRDGKAKMGRMVEVVGSIAANSEKVNKITEVIEKIANKTNLLSLNAAIEAARAGEHGRGFAVVAEEVGKLAANSAESTQEIAALVQQAVAEANRAVTAAKEVAADMDRIEAGALVSDGMLQRISAALEQQSSAVQEINANIANLNQIAESNATASEEMTSTVVELSKIADNTRREVEKFAA